MSEKLRQTMTEAECEALCAWLESPEGCTFQQETPWRYRIHELDL